jgi:hypothetical protein
METILHKMFEDKIISASVAMEHTDVSRVIPTELLDETVTGIAKYIESATKVGWNSFLYTYPAALPNTVSAIIEKELAAKGYKITVVENRSINISWGDPPAENKTQFGRMTCNYDAPTPV